MADSEFPCLEKKATQSAFARLVGVSQQAIRKHVGKTLRPGESLAQWVKTYCEDIRQGAAGRGGDDHATLTKARIESENVKSANGLIDYHVKIGTLVQASEAEAVLVEWADFTGREMDNCIKALMHELEAKFDVSIDDNLVNKFVNPSNDRISNYAEKLGKRITDSGEGVSAS